MRTTVTLADDVAAAVERLRRERSIGVSEAVNELVRKGLASKPGRRPFVQKTHDMGEAYVDYTNVWEAIEAVEGPSHR
jgi:Ribbon-helix-helix protein, copG family